MLFKRKPSFERQAKQLRIETNDPAKQLVAEFVLRRNGTAVPDERHGGSLRIDTNWLPASGHEEPSPLIVHSSLWVTPGVRRRIIQATTDIHAFAPTGGREAFVTITTAPGAQEAFLGPNEGGQGLAIARLALEHIDSGKLAVPRQER